MTLNEAVERCRKVRTRLLSEAMKSAQLAQGAARASNMDEAAMFAKDAEDSKEDAEALALMSDAVVAMVRRA